MHDFNFLHRTSTWWRPCTNFRKWANPLEEPRMSVIQGRRPSDKTTYVITYVVLPRHRNIRVFVSLAETRMLLHTWIFRVIRDMRSFGLAEAMFFFISYVFLWNQKIKYFFLLSGMKKNTGVIRCALRRRLQWYKKDIFLAPKWHTWSCLCTAARSRVEELTFLAAHIPTLTPIR